MSEKKEYCVSHYHIITVMWSVTLRYIPLEEEIQRQMADKAKVWVGITKVGRTPGCCLDLHSQS